MHSNNFAYTVNIHRARLGANDFTLFCLFTKNTYAAIVAIAELHFALQEILKIHKLGTICFKPKKKTINVICIYEITDILSYLLSNRFIKVNL